MGFPIPVRQHLYIESGPSITPISLGMGLANGKRRYLVKPSIIGPQPIQNEPWYCALLEYTHLGQNPIWFAFYLQCVWKDGVVLVFIYIYIYTHIKWTVFVNVTTKSAPHAHARMIIIIVDKCPNSSHLYSHGFMDNTNRQAVCKSQKYPLSDSQTAEELH